MVRTQCAALLLRKLSLASHNRIMYMQWVICQLQPVFFGMCILVTVQHPKAIAKSYVVGRVEVAGHVD